MGDSLAVKYPVEYGMVANWDDFELIFHQAFYDKMRIDPADHPVMLAEASMTPRCNREKMLQVGL